MSLVAPGVLVGRPEELGIDERAEPSGQEASQPGQDLVRHDGELDAQRVEIGPAECQQRDRATCADREPARRPGRDGRRFLEGGGRLQQCEGHVTLVGTAPHNLDDAPLVPTDDPIDREDPALDDLIPKQSNQPYDMIRLVSAVVDDGQGFPFKGRYTLDDLTRDDRGPRTLRERVAALGGSMVLETGADGSRVRLVVPLKGESA